MAPKNIYLIPHIPCLTHEARQKKMFYFLLIFGYMIYMYIYIYVLYIYYKYILIRTLVYNPKQVRTYKYTQPFVTSKWGSRCGYLYVHCYVNKGRVGRVSRVEPTKTHPTIPQPTTYQSHLPYLPLKPIIAPNYTNYLSYSPECAFW